MQVLYRHAPARSDSPQDRKSLIDAAASGAEIGLFIDSNAFPEWLLFDGAMIVNDQFYGWTSPYVGQGRRGPSLDRKYSEVVRCVFGTDGNTAVLRRCIKTGARRNNVYKPFGGYRSFVWTQLSPARKCTDREAGLKPHRIRCSVSFNGAVLFFKPAIVYFGDNAMPGDPIASVKSEEFSLPSSLVSALTGEPCNDDCDVLLYAAKDESRAIITRQDRRDAPKVVMSGSVPEFYLAD